MRNGEIISTFSDEFQEMEVASKLFDNDSFERMTCDDFLNNFRTSESDDLRYKHWLLSSYDLQCFHKENVTEEMFIVYIRLSCTFPIVILLVD